VVGGVEVLDHPNKSKAVSLKQAKSGPSFKGHLASWPQAPNCAVTHQLSLVLQLWLYWGKGAFSRTMFNNAFIEILLSSLNGKEKNDCNPLLHAGGECVIGQCAGI
jgi:hypothetical protein